MSSLDYPVPPETAARPFGVPNVLTLGAGPCTVSPRVLHALSAQTLQPLNIYHHQIMNEIKEMSRYVLQTKNEIIFALQASGNGGVETMVNNLADPGDTVIVCVSGFWGKRLAIICSHYKLNVVELQSPPGEVFSLEEVEQAIKKHKATAVFLTHAETITGLLQPLENWGHMCHKYDCLIGIDAVVSVAATPIFTDRWGIDAVVGGSQKAIGCVAGLSIVTFSPLAKERIWKKKYPTPFYFDVKGLYPAWSSSGIEKKYHITYNSNMLAALHQALSQICEEGLENVWDRHKQCAELLWPGLEKLGIRLSIPKAENRFCSVTSFELPSDIDRFILIEQLSNRYSLEISIGMTGLRVGFMGYNARSDAVKYFLQVLEESMEYIRKNKIRETSVHEKFVLLGVLEKKSSQS